MAPKYFPSILCVKMSADDRGIHNASCENRTPYVFPSHQLISPEAVSTGHSLYNAYVIGDYVYWKMTIVYNMKLPQHVEKVIMMVNNAGDVFKLCISTKRNHKLYSRYARYISY